MGSRSGSWAIYTKIFPIIRQAAITEYKSLHRLGDAEFHATRWPVARLGGRWPVVSGWKRKYRTPVTGHRPPTTDYSTRNTFITSSPRWLITLTAIRPEAGLSNGRDVSLCSDSHASSSISALRVVFSDLYGSFAPRK